MRHFLAGLALLVSVFLVGCGGGSIVGKWKPDVNSMKIKADDPKMQALIEKNMAKAKESANTATLEFKSDGTFTANPGGAGQATSGKWTQSGNTITLTGDKGESTPITVSLAGGNLTMHVSIMGITEDITFTRA